MKINTKLIIKKLIIGIFIVGVLFIILSIVFGWFNNSLAHINKILGINIDNCKIENEKNTHGGFLGDGDYFAKLVCRNINDNEIKTKWKLLPVVKELQDVLEMKQCDSNSCIDVYEKYKIPKLDNGYYYFLNRKGNTTSNNEETFDNSSYNFSVAIYDSDNKIIYFYEIDT